MLLRFDPFISLWTFSLGLCLGNLYASTCKHVHCSIHFSVLWPDVSFRIMQIPETLRDYGGEFDPSAR